ncbi:hypothetical protein BDV12DRAFT_176940 [Aspergillus spectabilis]
MQSMVLCPRGFVYLFKLVKREQELDHTILGFAIAHNHQIVIIHGQYLVINGEKVTYHSYEISEFILNKDTRWL